MTETTRSPTLREVSERLNRECFCITLDREALCRALERETADAQFCARWIQSRPHLFSSSPVFLPEGDIAGMLRIVRAIEAATRLPAYRETVLGWASAIARSDPGPLGVFMGYDFHLAAGGPKLIEINTNAGGAFLNALLAKVQRACCEEVELGMARSGAEEFESATWGMFQREWSRQRSGSALCTVAIIDDRPEEQYLYPEFVLAQRFFQKNGVEVLIADAVELRHEQGALVLHGKPIDLVYNRLIDFSLQAPEHEALRSAYLAGAVVVTPNPHVHALFADKRNLTLLSDQATMRTWGLPEPMVAALAGVPRTVLVTPENAQHLWETRKSLFFKPAAGYGSKAVYRGDKLTRGVWHEINRGAYVAQEFAAPGERMIRLDGSVQARKADVRLYVYDGELLLAAARLYQGQATNFRTPGGGFAPVFMA